MNSSDTTPVMAAASSFDRCPSHRSPGLRSRRQDESLWLVDRPLEDGRWSFTEITADSFHWLGERSLDDGATWQLQAEFFARRVAA